MDYQILIKLAFNRATLAFTKTWIQDVNILQILPNIFDFDIRLSRLKWEFGDISHEDALILLCLLAKHLDAKEVFEFGTFKGRTTYNLALNLPNEGHVYTLDLPSKQAIASKVQKNEMQYMNELGIHKERVGEVFKNSELREKITSLLGNSKTFDFSPYFNRMDLIFIDGGHALDVITRDTENAFKMLKNKGIIVWDDYGYVYPDVKRFLDRLSFKKKLFKDVRTGLVLYISPEEIPRK